ncbi:MAG: AI-2E family transporter, partial [Bacteroidota bacterium]
MNLPRQPVPLYISASIKLFLLGLIILLLILAKELLVPLTIAVFLSFILLPISQRLERYRFPRSLAVFTSIVLAFVIISGFIWFLYIQMQSFGEDAEQLKIKTAEKINSLQIYIREHFNITKRDQSIWMDKKIAGTMEEGDQYLLTFFSVTGSFLTNLALIPLYVYFITMYRTKIKTFVSLKSNGDHENTLNILQSISHVAQKYLKGLTIDLIIVTALCSIAFLLIGVKHAILFGILVAVCNIIIPYMGLTFASIFPF